MNKVSFSAICIVCVIFLSDAMNMSWMQNARMLDKGTMELLPTATGFKDEGAFRPAWGINYGMLVTYGVNDRFNLTFRNSPYTYFLSDQTISFTYLGVATKVNLLHDWIAVMLPVGINISEYYSIQTDLKLYLTKVFTSNISVSLCPTISILAGEESTHGYGTDFNITFPLRSKGNDFIIETGYYNMDEGTNVFAGIGFQLEYWKDTNE